MRLTSLEKVKLFLGITTTTDDELLGIILDGVSDAIETDCGRAIALGTYNEKYDITQDYVDNIQLNNYPVISVVALTDNTVLLTVDTQYYWNKYGWVQRLPMGGVQDTGRTIAGYFTIGYQKVAVMYTAGYDPIPDDVQLVCMKLTAQVYNVKDTGSYESEKIGDYSYKTLTEAKISDPFLESVLKRYRRVW